MTITLGTQKSFNSFLELISEPSGTLSIPTPLDLGFKIKVVKRAGVAVKRLLKRERTVMKSLSKKEERLALWKHCKEKQSTMKCRI